jgi:hypothetical protein
LIRSPEDARSLSPPLQDWHDANLDRVFEALQGIVVPPGNIVVLDGTKARATTTDAFPNLGLGSHFIDGPITRANWNSALAGTLFTGVAPNANSKLLVYNTGHGESWDAKEETRFSPRASPRFRSRRRGRCSSS